MNGKHRFIFLYEGEGLDIYYEAANPCEHEADNLRSEESKNNVRLSCARFFLGLSRAKLDTVTHAQSKAITVCQSKYKAHKKQGRIDL